MDDLLDVTRMAANKFELQVRDADFGDIVQAAVQTVQPAAGERGVTLQWTKPAIVVPVCGDALGLQQAVWNLLSNAIKFSNEGGLVLASLGIVEDRATLRVTDHGRGIEPALLPRVFERFWLGDTTNGRRGGLGLGLSIAQHIVQRHGGELGASSAGVGHGANFPLTLPTKT